MAGFGDDELGNCVGTGKDRGPRNVGQAEGSMSSYRRQRRKIKRGAENSSSPSCAPNRLSPMPAACPEPHQRDGCLPHGECLRMSRNVRLTIVPIPRTTQKAITFICIGLIRTWFE